MSAKPFAISRELEARRFEQCQVKLVLGELGLQDATHEVEDAYSAITGERGLSFLALGQVFPGMPILFVATPMYGLVDRVECSQTSLFRDYRRYLPYQHYEAVYEMAEDQARGRPIGMLYRWHGIKHGLIIHNGDFPSSDFAQVLPWGEQVLMVQHFRRFLKTLAAGPWTPQMLRIPATPDAKPEPWQPPGAWQLAKLVPDKAEFRLLSLLLHILYHMPVEYRRRYIVRRDGERWIAVVQDWLAATLKCSPRTVQRAMAGLRQKGLIESSRDPGTAGQIRVCIEGFSR